MIKECKVITWNELVMVIKFNEELIQMPSIEKRQNTVFVKFDNERYELITEDEYKRSLIKTNKRGLKKELNDIDE